MKKLLTTAIALTFTGSVLATESADMSNPLAVFNVVGASYGTQGANLKVGIAYDTEDENTMAMHIVEIKDNAENIRYRHFGVDTTTGRGLMVDVGWDTELKQGSAALQVMQALPKFGPFQLFPVIGGGMGIAEGIWNEPGYEEVVGYTMPGGFLNAGMYAKMDITDKLWLNYNPMYTHGMSGLLTGESAFNNEFIASYKTTENTTVRAFYNVASGKSFTDGDARVEFNYAF
jgi:hypothetical protein